MSHEAIRWANATEAFALVWLWLAWVIHRLHKLASRFVGFSLVPVWMVLSYGAVNAAEHHLQYNNAAPWLTVTLGAVLVTVALDILPIHRKRGPQ